MFTTESKICKIKFCENSWRLKVKLLTISPKYLTLVEWKCSEYQSDQMILREMVSQNFQERFSLRCCDVVCCWSPKTERQSFDGLQIYLICKSLLNTLLKISKKLEKLHP